MYMYPVFFQRTKTVCQTKDKNLGSYDDRRARTFKPRNKKSLEHHIEKMKIFLSEACSHMQISYSTTGYGCSLSMIAQHKTVQTS